jgi:hypothetical protein
MRTVGSLALNSLAIRSDKNRGHEAQGAVSLSDDVTLHNQNSRFDQGSSQVVRRTVPATPAACSTIDAASMPTMTEHDTVVQVAG